MASFPVLQLAFKAPARPRSDSNTVQPRARQRAFCKHCGSFISGTDNYVADARGVYHSICFNFMLSHHYGQLGTPGPWTYEGQQQIGGAPLQASPKVDWSGGWYEEKKTDLQHS